ncbi:hypothetical protein WICMUC_004287 [Wickerhamomyces mucosus]|uniref:Uncharacterized protein n=1 Tax=Wickerhamomyces mucosus TaxID=1378264 RepID=A0A9P8TAV4_9ASCO|nr:hypothetical protein WICMUC_004287 [Wickerhamomyces mucosus]
MMASVELTPNQINDLEIMRYIIDNEIFATSILNDLNFDQQQIINQFPQLNLTNSSLKLKLIEFIKNGEEIHKSGKVESDEEVKNLTWMDKGYYKFFVNHECFKEWNDINKSLDESKNSEPWISMTPPEGINLNDYFQIHKVGALFEYMQDFQLLNDEKSKEISQFFRNKIQSYIKQVGIDQYVSFSPSQ